MNINIKIKDKSKKIKVLQYRKTSIPQDRKTLTTIYYVHK